MPLGSDTASWHAVSHVYEEAVRRYAEQLAQDPRSDATEATVRTNTELVPRRARDVLLILRELADLPSIAGLHVLDLGSGWGSVSTFLAMTQGPERVVAVDFREDFIDTAKACSRAAGVDQVEFVLADMVDLEPLQAEQFDVVIANNSLLYITEPDGLATALREARRVARPSAALAVHQANRFQLRDPFTRAPVVHLLGRRAAGLAKRAVGWEASSDRVRLVSTGQMRREVERAGFGVVRTGVITSPGQVRSGAVPGARFFALGARKPA